MLVATPGQTTAYSTIHNNNNNNSSSNGGGGGGNSTAATTSSNKKATTTLNSANASASGTPKSLNNNNNHTVSTVANKNSLNTNTHGPVSYNYHANPKNDNSVSNKHSNQTKMTATSSRETISTIVTATAITHSLKNENSTNNTTATNTTTTTTTKQQSFIQTLKDSVQKALISTTGSSTTLAHKHATDNKLPNNCNNLTTSIQNVTSSSSSTSHNANKVSTTTSSTNSSHSTAATQSSTSSSVSLVRSKYFSCSLSKLHTVAPTIIHRYPEERQHASSTDSLQKEMCHFKPIRIVPTTPWKSSSGSKSRGNSLRFPKANLASKKTEFVLKSNCDLNNRKKKQQQNRTQTDKINVDEDNHDDDDDNNEQENKEFYGIYKPKPSSTCLSTSATTPNHQSAFVCLVAQMKSLVNIQSKKQHSSVKAASAEMDLSEPIKELYVRKKPATKKSLQLEVSKELPKTRTTRLSSNAVKNKRVSNTTINTLNHSKENVKRTNAKSNNLSKLSTVAITKAKSRRKLGRAKSKTINLVNLATTRAKGKLQTSVSMPAVISNEAKNTAATTSKRTRKRKIAHEDETEPPTKTASIKSLAPAARKSSRQTKDMTSTTTKQNPSQTTLKSSQKSTRKIPATVVCFSPPLTRSRLKHLAEQGMIITSNTPTDVKKRRN